MSAQPTSARPTSPLAALTEAASRALGVSRVFGDPIETPAGSVIPVATVFGGHGLGFRRGRLHGRGRRRCRGRHRRR